MGLIVILFATIIISILVAILIITFIDKDKIKKALEDRDKEDKHDED